MAGEGRQSLPGGTGENHEFRSQVSQSTDSHANTVPPEYGAVVPTADRCSVLRYFKGSHPLRRSLYHAGRNRRFFCGRVQAFGMCVYAGPTSTEDLH